MISNSGVSENLGGSGPPSPSLSVSSSEHSRSSGNTGFDANRIAGVKAWLVSQFDVAGKDVPDFEYTSRSIAHLHNVATLSQAKTQAATIVANDFRQKATEYRSQGLSFFTNIYTEILDHVVSSSQVLAKVANLLNIRDTELSSFLVAMADLSEENSSRIEEGESAAGVQRTS
ncbi:hypothetical protein ACS0TY_031804 [Phlomoides rotata]